MYDGMDMNETDKAARVSTRLMFTNACLFLVIEIIYKGK